MDIYLGLGSNLGDRRETSRAPSMRSRRMACDLVRVSPVVESPAMLPDDAPPEWNVPFLNLVAECRTDAPPRRARRLKAIERELGRVERGRWAPRPIDLDILLWGRETIATERLRVPHPGITERAFVLTPLAALEPHLTIPGRGTRRCSSARAGGITSPAVDGNRERHARLVLGRRQLVDDAAVDARRRRARRPPAQSSSTSARSPHARRDAADARTKMGAPRARARPRSSTAIAARCCGRASASIPITPRPHGARSRSART